MIFGVYRVKNIIKDPKTGEVIDEDTEEIAEISVSEVKEKSATCVIMRKLSPRPIAVQDKVEQKN